MASILKGQSGQPIQFETKPNVNGDDVLVRPDIVGTVSQSGGVPTGAIIERGSNVNGEFVKFADGTMICTYRIPFTDETFTAIGGVAVSGVRNWIYPHGFHSAPRVSITGASQPNTFSWGSVNTPTTVNVELRLLAPDPSSSITSAADLLAIGHWKE